MLSLNTCREVPKKFVIIEAHDSGSRKAQVRTYQHAGHLVRTQWQARKVSMHETAASTVRLIPSFLSILEPTL